MLRIIRRIFFYVVLLGTMVVSLYLFVTGNNWGGFGVGLILLFEVLMLALADAMARDFGEKIIEDTKRENYVRGYEDGCKKDNYLRGYEAGFKEGEKKRERRE